MGHPQDTGMWDDDFEPPSDGHNPEVRERSSIDVVSSRQEYLPGFLPVKGKVIIVLVCDKGAHHPRDSWFREESRVITVLDCQLILPF